MKRNLWVKNPEQIINDLAKSLTHAQLVDLRDLLYSGDAQVCKLLHPKVEAAQECDRLLLEATRALGEHWKRAVPLVAQLEELANQHGLGFYLLQADSLRYSCGRERAHEARQTKF